MVLFSIVLYRTIVTSFTDNIFLYNYLQQMHQLIHLSPVGCFTPALGKSMQKNREVCGVKVLKFNLNLNLRFRLIWILEMRKFLRLNRPKKFLLNAVFRKLYY